MGANVRGQLCPVCGKPLQRTTCLACSGKGFTRAFLMRRRTCENCGGVGVIWRCPDYFLHMAEAINQKYGIGQVSKASLSGSSNPRPQPQPCPLCGGTGGIVFNGRAGPCPTCGGRGTIMLPF